MCSSDLFPSHDTHFVAQDLEKFEANLRSLFGDRFEITSGKRKYDLAMSYINDGDTDTVTKCVSCLAFFIQPLKYVIMGKTKDGSGSALKTDLYKILPHHKDDWLEELSRSSLESDRKTLASRKELPENYQTVNFTMCKTVAMMFLQASHDKKRVYGKAHEAYLHKQPHSPYSGHLEKSAFKDERAYVIKLDLIRKFATEKSLSQKLVKDLENLLPS